MGKKVQAALQKTENRQQTAQENTTNTFEGIT